MSAAKPFLHALLALLALVIPASADIFDVLYGTGYPPSALDIRQLNQDTGAGSNLYVSYPNNNSAAMAQRPSDGMIFYIAGTSGNDRVYRWNPATPAVAPVFLGTTGGSVNYMPRLAFAQNGVLYGVNTAGTTLYTLNQSTGAATSAATFTSPASGGGDLAFSTDGLLYMVSGNTLYRLPLGGGATVTLGTITGGGSAHPGMAFNNRGELVIVSDSNPATLYAVNLSTRVATAVGSTGGALGDLASAPGQAISGRVFEDVNYGGGAGRSLAAASGVGLANARVELYDNAGNFIIATTTNATGNYTLAGAAGHNYIVRVVNSMVPSSRSGYVAGLLPVQTFRTTATSGSAVAVTDRVGGENPAVADAVAGSTGTRMNPATGVFTAGITGQAQSITTVTTSTTIGGTIPNADFGFNFDTIVNVNDGGQGSLRQFITNANALTNAGLAQVGQTAGRETSLFMITDGAAHAGLRAGLANQLTGGVATIVPVTALPAVTGADTTIDGSTQTANVGNTNATTLGTGGTVGVDALALGQVAGPEVAIRDAGSLAIGIHAQANNLTVRGLAIYGFGAADGEGAIVIANNYTVALIENNILGSAANSFTDPGAALRNYHGVAAEGGDSGTIRNNLIGFAAKRGIHLVGGSTSWTVDGNEIRDCGASDTDGDGIAIRDASPSNTLTRNLIVGASTQGFIVTGGGTPANVFANNTVAGNGIGTPSVVTQSAGITMRSGVTAVVLDRNIVRANYGAGISVNSGASGVLITRNSVFDNGTVAARNGAGATGQIGIDLNAAGDDINLGTAPFRTLNDSGDGDAGGNALLNFPVFQTAAITGGNLVLSGFARPGSVIELFIADSDPGNFGEGRTYLGTLTEGSGADSDASTGTYTNPVNGLNQGTDTTNRFTFIIPTPGGVANGTRLTATATLSGATSEFSGVATVFAAQSISGTVYNDVNRNSRKETTETGTGLALFVKLIDPALPPASPALAAATVTPATGAYTITGVAAGIFTLVLDDNATLTDTTPTLPASWMAIESSGGRRPNVAVAAIPVSGQDFGLNQGKPVVDRVFVDTGTGAGTANNGVQDGTEAGLANVTVRLTDNAGTTTYSTATTDGAGNFALAYPTSLTTGTVLKIVETNRTGYVSTGAVVGDTGGTYARATDTVTFTLTANNSYANLAFGDVPATMLNTDGVQAALPGATIFYPHTFTAGTAGTVNFSVINTPTPAIPGWSPVLYRDSNANGVFDAGEPQITAPIAVTAGQVVAVLVKEFVPLNAPIGAKNQATLTASFVFANAPAITATLTRTDITTVGPPQAGALLLTKVVDKATALPGETLTYTITYTNRGTDPLNTLSIHDATPAFSTFTSAANGPLPASLTGVSLTAPSAGAAGAIRWNFTGPLAPGSTGTVSFTVTIDQ